MTIFIMILSWLVIGQLGFMFWYTKDHDLLLSFNDMSLLILFGLTGILSWFLCWTTYGNKDPIVLIHKRK